MKRWFDSVQTQGKLFVADTRFEFDAVFPDHLVIGSDRIGSLRCGSVVNLPLVIGDELVARINLLLEEHRFIAARVAHIQKDLSLPLLAA